MSQAIYYMSQSSNENATSLNDAIPAQAVTIPLDKQLDKTTLLNHLAIACDFPSYFSHNWDSAWDCLTDSEIKYLKLDLTAVEQINTEDFNIFKAIIEDAYKDFGKPQLWVIVPYKDEA